MSLFPSAEDCCRGLVCCVALLSMLVATNASAQECETDADCTEGQVCEVVAESTCGCAPCPPGEECPPCDCGEPEQYRECVTPPITCTEDTDCPDGLSCLFVESGVPCTTDEDGNTNCAEPEGSDEGYCEFVPSSCTSDADCDEGFACELYDVGGTCVGMCDEDGNCEEICDEPEVPTEGSCYPQQIDCEADTDCPSEWSCHTFTGEACSGGGGSVGGGCACPDCEPGQDCPPCDCEEPMPEPIEEEECTEYTENYCLPPGWDAWVDSSIGGGGGFDEATDGAATPNVGGEDGDNGQTNTEDGTTSADDEPLAGTDSEESAGSGCAVSAGSTSGSTGLLAVLLGMTLVLFRRRA